MKGYCVEGTRMDLSREAATQRVSMSNTKRADCIQAQPHRSHAYIKIAVNPPLFGAREI